MNNNLRTTIRDILADGINPTIDGRCEGVCKSLGEETMNMSRAACSSLYS